MFYALLEEWQDCPPAHVSIAAFMGIKPKQKSIKQTEIVESLQLEYE